MVVCLNFAVTTVLDTPFPVWYNDVDYTPVTPGSEADLTMVSVLIATCVSCREGAIKWFIYVFVAGVHPPPNLPIQYGGTGAAHHHSYPTRYYGGVEAWLDPIRVIPRHYSGGWYVHTHDQLKALYQCTVSSNNDIN
jgi:hypothetical protein